jgi:hypothetical protein
MNPNPNRRTSALLNVLTGTLATAAIAGTLLFSELPPAWAQHAVIASGSDGPGEGGHMFVMPAFPNRFDALLRPDFARRDVPLFHEHLNLAEDQMYVLEVLMDSYTEQFTAAVDEFRSVQKRYRLKLPGMDGDMLGGHMMDPDMMGEIGGLFHVDEGGDEGHEILQLGDMEFVLESSGQVQIGITHTIDTDVSVANQGDGEPQVAISFFAEDENGESILTDEQIEQIKEGISEQIKERLANVELKRQEMQALRDAAAALHADGAAAEEGPAATAEEVAKAGRALIAERNRLRQELVGDVTLLLNDEQKAKWPAFERTQRRISTMRFGEFGGESVDVLRILNQQQPKVEKQGAFAAAKEQYETALEQALKSRNELLPEHEIEMLLATEEMIQSHAVNEEDRLDLMDRVADARAAVRNANLAAAGALEPLLATDERAEFRESVLREAYPHVYGAGSTQRSLEAAVAFGDLDDETRTAITTLAADYNAQLAALNDRIAAEIRKEEPRQHRKMMASLNKIREIEMQREAGGEIDFSALEFDEDQSLKLIQERRSLNKRTLDQLRGMLTEEQIAQLPQSRRRLPTFFGGGNGPPPGAQGVRVIKTESKSE